MLPSPRSGRNRSSPEPPRRIGFVKPHVGPVGAGVLAMLAGFPVLAQVGAFPPTEPAQEERLPTTEPEPTQAAPPSPTGAPPTPVSPFGLSPDTFPGIVGGRPPPAAAPPFGAPAPPESPFGLSPDIFPGILGGRPDRRTLEQPALPSSEPGISPGISPGTSPGTPSGVPTAPAATPSEAAPGPEQGTPAVAPQPGLATTPALTQPFVAPPYGFGNLGPAPFLGPSPTAPPGAPSALASGGLAPLVSGAVPVQAYDNRAPWILIRPAVSAAAVYTDNPANNAGGGNNNKPSAYGRTQGNVAVSVDTVRLQGQLTGGLDYLKYARSGVGDQLNGNLLGYGLGTVVQDHVFIDARTALTQASRLGGLGFAGPNLIPAADQTQLFTSTLTPIFRQSFGGYADGELRYSYGISRSNNGGLFGTGSSNTTTTAAASTNLSSATSNEVTASLATGRLFTLFGSRLTLDAAKVNSQTASQSNQLRAYDDLSYPFNNKFAGLARLGYENLNYPLQPGASTKGPTGSLGGQYTPSPGNYLIGTYGYQEGFPGFNGVARYEIAPFTVASASVTHNRSSQQQQALNNLNSSYLDPNGNVVDQVSGLPIALVNPQFALSNAVFRYDTARAGVTTQLDRNTLGLFGFYERRRELGTPIGSTTPASTLNTTSAGVSVSWARSLTPDLSSNAILGYAAQTSESQRTLTASFRMTYALSEKLSAILDYQFIDTDSDIAGNSYRRNQVEIGLTRSF